MKGVLRYIGLRRRVTVTVPVEIAQAQQNLGRALQDDIILGGPWNFIKRRYWGNLNRDRLTLQGPNEGHKQLCFLTRGYLSPGETPHQTRLELEIVLSQFNEIQLIGSFATAIFILGWLLRPIGLAGLPFFLALIYGSTQWHFSHYTAEIRQLLCDRMIGNPGEHP
ncbi:MAG: hypothetical protein AAGE59_24305 [Cyanobacteria bacterium P01_F01_bin.86]